MSNALSYRSAAFDAGGKFELSYQRAFLPSSIQHKSWMHRAGWRTTPLISDGGK
jgi:hypothetical protein